jgi:predicted RNA-binding protein YlqC (UPF0109 family)
VDTLEEALDHLVRGIVEHDEDVRVDMTTNRRGRTLRVHVHPEDLGKVIGRGGRTATALRTVMTAVGGRGLRVDVVDTDGRCLFHPCCSPWAGSGVRTGSEVTSPSRCSPTIRTPDSPRAAPF